MIFERFPIGAEICETWKVSFVLNLPCYISATINLPTCTVQYDAYIFDNIQKYYNQLYNIQVKVKLF